MRTNSIHYETTFPCTAKTVYQLFIDPEKHSLITESKVHISSKPDGKFEVYDGYCKGYNIQLIENQKIVQAWHFDEEDWPANHFSICTFEFEDIDSGCRMTFDQTEVPETSVNALTKGWKDFYWDRMDILLGSKK